MHTMIDYRVIILVWCCACPFWAVGCAPAASAPTPTPVIDPAPYLAEAAQLAQERAYSAALARLEQAPPSAAVAAAKGDIYRQQQNWPLAQRAFEDALARQSQNYTATVGLAEALLRQKMSSQSYWQRAVTLDETQPAGWLGLGRANLAELDFAGAEQAFARAAPLDPDYQAQWYLAALALPVHPEEGQKQLAAIPGPSARRDYLLAALEGTPAHTGNAEKAALIGVALLQLDEPALAYHALEVAAELDPEQAQTWAFLGHTQAQLGLPALESFNRAKKISPGLVLTLYFEGIYLRRHQQDDLALDRFLTAADLDPGNLAIAVETARTLEQKGDLLSAEAWYQAVVEAEPESAEYRQFLTEFYVNRSYRVAEAGLPSAEKLAELAPQSARAFDLLGWARFQTGDYAGAETALRQAVTLDPADVPVRYHLGRVLKAQRRPAEAQAEMTRVLDWDTSGIYRDRILKGEP